MCHDQWNGQYQGYNANLLSKEIMTAIKLLKTKDRVHKMIPISVFFFIYWVPVILVNLCTRLSAYSKVTQHTILPHTHTSDNKAQWSWNGGWPGWGGEHNKSQLSPSDIIVYTVSWPFVMKYCVSSLSFWLHSKQLKGGGRVCLCVTTNGCKIFNISYFKVK